jgi:chemotaxis protein MotB
MSQGHEDVGSQPLVIVRRRRNTDEPHHGGVWKIAYADFMTAMMAFFLVMWLVNAADKKTIVQVAAYFNPMRLTDRFEAPRGLEDLTDQQSKIRNDKEKRGFEKSSADDKHEAPEGKEGNDVAQEKSSAPEKGSSNSKGAKSNESKEAEEKDEQALFKNPAATLEKLAEDVQTGQPGEAVGTMDGNVSDPFDRTDRPAGRSDHVRDPGSKAASVASKKPSKVILSEATSPAQTPQDLSPIKQPKEGEPPVKEGEAELHEKQQSGATQAPSALAASNQQKQQLAEVDQPEKQAEELKSEIDRSVATMTHDVPQIEVKATSEGILVSLTDDVSFGMFEVGSAKPRPELVVVMQKIGKLLADKKGDVVVRGHTDARPYKNALYDNWRLSSARAQMAYYMLLRGGIDDKRIVAIEGRADRDPKLPFDTMAAANRRIDILIREAKK